MADTSRNTILLVQPERDDRDMYSEFLRHEGFEVIVVSEGADALAVAPRADIVVIEILLPGPMDGIETVGRIRRDERRRTPIIVLTACAWKSDRDHAALAGCDVFLAKPCLPDTLAREIRRLLSLQRVPQPEPARTLPPGRRVQRDRRHS